MEDKKSVKKSKGGRPKWIPDQQAYDSAFHYASIGLTEEQIAHNLGISYETLNERKKEYPEFADNIKRGKSYGIETVANKLFESAQAGNLGAQIFYLKARASWKEINTNEHTGVDGKPIELNSKSSVSVSSINDHINVLLGK